MNVVMLLYFGNKKLLFNILIIIGACADRDGFLAPSSVVSRK